MKLLSLAIGLLSLLFAGVVEAKDAKFLEVTIENVAQPLPKGKIEGCCQDNRPKKVVFEYDDVIRIMADKEHREKLLHQCKAGDAILVQIGKEKDRKITILEGQVKNLLETAETQERLGATEAQINEALQKQLAKVTQDLDAEKSKKYWWAGGSAVSSAAIVTAIFLWVVN